MNSDPKIINNFDDLFPIPNRSASKICSNRHSADGDGTRGRPMAPRGGGGRSKVNIFAGIPVSFSNGLSLGAMLISGSVMIEG